MSTRIKWLLAVSLVLNVFLVGGIAGGMYRWWSAGPQTAAVQRSLRLAAEALPAERRDTFRDTLRNARRDIQPTVREARESRRELVRLLAAPQFDRPAVEAALGRARQADAVIRARVEREVVEFASTLPEDERNKFVQGLVQRGPLRQLAQPGNPAQQPGEGAGAATPATPASRP